MSLISNVCLVGGGSSAHALAPLLSTRGHRVSIYTTRPGNWNSEIILNHFCTETSKVIKTLSGHVSKASAHPRDVVSDADIVILCLPVSSYREVLAKIAPHLSQDKTVYVGTIYGQGGFNWAVQEALSGLAPRDVRVFACGLIPWICRTVEYGKSAVTFGAKEVNVAATYTQEDFHYLQNSLFNNLCFDWFGKGKFFKANNFLSLTMSVDNQIIHTSRLFALFQKSPNGWTSKDRVPYFYRDYDEQSAKVLLDLDLDYSKIRHAITSKFPEKNFDYMLDYLSLEKLTYGSSNDSILESFLNSKTLGTIETPTTLSENGRYVLNKTHRFFSDDFAYGLCIAKWFANYFNLHTECLDEIIVWGEKMLDTKMIRDGRLIDENLIGMACGAPSFYNKDLGLDVFA